MPRKAKDGRAISSSPIRGTSPVVGMVVENGVPNASEILLALSSLLQPGSVRSLADCIARYEREHLVDGELKPSTLERERLACRRLRDWFGDEPCTGSHRAAAVEIHNRLPRSTAQHTCGCLARVLDQAQRWGWRPDGDHQIGRLSHVTWNRRTRVLSQTEVAGLFAAIGILAETKRSQSCLEAIRLIAFSSLRVSEACGLRWDEVAPDCRVLFLRDSKTGPRPVVLAQLAADVIRRQPRGHFHVFPGRDPKRPITRRAVLHVCKEAAALAGIREVCVHVLRHTFATRALEVGVHTRHAAELLGHSSEWMTSAYQHVNRSDLRDAADRIATSLILKGGPHG